MQVTINNLCEILLQNFHINEYYANIYLPDDREIEKLIIVISNK